MQNNDRRQILIARMGQLEAQKMSCHGCTGRCCTFESNSMMLTPLEAWEIMTFLQTQGLLTPDLKTKLHTTASQYNLHPRYSQQRSYLRKTYTCPFFGHRELGCSLPPEVKPYGCLAFNSHHESSKADAHCFSEISLLERREEAHPYEKDLNEQLKKQYSITWEKSPIPNALLDLWDYFEEKC